MWQLTSCPPPPLPRPPKKQNFVQNLVSITWSLSRAAYRKLGWMIGWKFGMNEKGNLWNISRAGTVCLGYISAGFFGSFCRSMQGQRVAWPQMACTFALFVIYDSTNWDDRGKCPMSCPMHCTGADQHVCMYQRRPELLTGSLLYWVKWTLLHIKRRIVFP